MFKMEFQQPNDEFKNGNYSQHLNIIKNLQFPGIFV